VEVGVTLCTEFFGSALGTNEFYKNSVNRNSALVECVSVNITAFIND
jgi:hypothetical protein